MAETSLHVKVATEPWELEQVYGLNYRTFVEEIPQHTPNEERLLVDRLLARSTCYVCLSDRRLRGMVAICDERPFSLDNKLADLDSHLPPSTRICEVRLLAVEPHDRGGLVFGALVRTLLSHARERGHDLAVLSGALRQLPIYRRIGCIPFGPLLGTPEAPYQAMHLSWESLSPSLLPLVDGRRAEPGREA